MSFEFHEIIPHMTNGLNTHLFYPVLRHTSLGRLLKQTSTPNTLDFLQTYFSSPKLIRLRFRNLLQNKYQKFILDTFFSAAFILQKKHLFNEANIWLFIRNNSPIVICNILRHLHYANILNQWNYDSITTHKHPLTLMDSIHLLHKHHLLTQENFAIIVEHNNSDNCAQALLYLNTANLLSQTNRDILGLYKYPMVYAYALTSLKNANMLNEANRTTIISHPYPIELVVILKLFHHANILTEENRILLETHPHPKELVSLLQLLDQADALTPRILNNIILLKHTVLLSLEARRRVWNKIPAHLMTEAYLTRLLIIAARENPIPALENEVNQIIGFNQLFNNSQSTHTASVHHSVSKSAIKLMRIYEKELNMRDQIKKIKIFIHHLPEHQSPEEILKNQAAKRCIERLTTKKFHFIDSAGISICELLALAFIAIHDDKKRIGTIEDALILLIEGLYEIQRGYNLNSQGIDIGGEDRPICAAGSFNKIIEKLNGIHPDVEVYCITSEGANAKFPIVAQNHAMGYLRTIASAKSARAYQTCKALIDELKEEGSLEPIWDKIQENVAMEIWDEFKAAYSNNPEHHLFVELIENSIYVPIPKDLSLIEEQLISSPGYIAYQKEQSLLQKHSLWRTQGQNIDTNESQNKTPYIEIII